MRYTLDEQGLPRLKSGELCISRNWVTTIRTLSVLPGGRSESAGLLADTAAREEFANLWNIYKLWQTIPGSLVHVRRRGASYKIILTQIGWKISRSGGFGKFF